MSSTSQQQRPSSAREELLDAARRLFIAKGYDAVSTREIAEAAGVNLGLIQYYFGSKAKLFVEVVTTAMEKDSPEEAKEALNAPFETAEEAAVSLAAFVHLFLEHLLLEKDPRACQMMIREMFSDAAGRDREMCEALLASVVNDFIRPLDRSLRRVISKLRPDAGEMELGLFSNSVVAQCIFYLTHGPFVAKLWREDFATEASIEMIAEHAAGFSLRGIGVGEDVIASARERRQLAVAEARARAVRGRE